MDCFRHAIAGAQQQAMRTMSLLAVAGCLTLCLGGCRLCCDSEDAAYPAYGGIWERTDRTSGRVGSVFDPGGARQAELYDRDSVEREGESRSEILPEDGTQDDATSPRDSETAPEEEPPPRRRDSESEEEFQERFRQFQERNEMPSEPLLNTQIILGPPGPPVLR